MVTRSGRYLILIISVFILGLTDGCGDGKDAEETAASAEDSLVALARKFQALRRSGDCEAARAMMSQNPRRWFEEREGEGTAWRVGPKSGPWAAWDAHFRSQSEDVRWEAGEGTATLISRETNDYFRLLERGWVTNETVYYFDSSRKIEGLLIRATGERPPGRTEQFLEWARAHDPDELEYLMPGGEIDPSGDRPERFRALLNRWRESAGLANVE